MLFSRQGLFFFVKTWGFLGWGSLEAVGSSVCVGLGPFLFWGSCGCTGCVALLRLPLFRLFVFVLITGGTYVAPQPNRKQHDLRPSIITLRAFLSSKVRRSGMFSRTSRAIWIKVSIV